MSDEMAKYAGFFAKGFIYYCIFLVLYNGAKIIFQIWTIIVSIRARKELCNNSGLILKNQISITSTTTTLQF